jgi:hypothetical protein
MSVAELRVFHYFKYENNFLKLINSVHHATLLNIEMYYFVRHSHRKMNTFNKGLFSYPFGIQFNAKDRTFVGHGVPPQCLLLLQLK